MKFLLVGFKLKVFKLFNQYFYYADGGKFVYYH